MSQQDALVSLLTLEGLRTDIAASGTEGLAMAERGVYDAILVDLHLPDMFGLTIVERLVARNVSAPIVVITGRYLEDEMEALALRAGASAFRRKPILCAEELAVMLRALIAGTASSASDNPIDSSKTALYSEVVAVSPAMRAILDWIDNVASTDATVLLTGETGTGKELVALTIHRASRRSGHPFVPVNCSAIPEGLLEAELFGHCRGAFTGAVRDKIGLVTAAHNGTLFLDEVADLSLPMQGHLLRFLESGEVRRVGDTKTTRVDVRVIAATNRSFRQELMKGRFREDLYYRLAVVQRNIPPLRERLDDLEALVASWLPRLAQRHHRNVAGISEHALALLRAYRWPGNVRELRNVLEQAVCLTRDEHVTAQDVDEALASIPLSMATDRMRALNLDLTLKALQGSRWNQTRAARALGINRTTIWRRLRRYGL